jgi:hypothetical protein
MKRMGWAFSPLILPSTLADGLGWDRGAPLALMLKNRTSRKSVESHVSVARHGAPAPGRTYHFTPLSFAGNLVAMVLFG